VFGVCQGKGGRSCRHFVGGGVTCLMRPGVGVVWQGGGVTCSLGEGTPAFHFKPVEKWAGFHKPIGGGNGGKTSVKGSLKRKRLTSLTRKLKDGREGKKSRDEREKKGQVHR